MEILERNPTETQQLPQTPQQTQQLTTITTGQRTTCLCNQQSNLNEMGFGKLRSTKHCASCPHYRGIITYPNNIIFPRLACSVTGNIKLLELYAQCNIHQRTLALNNCRKCVGHCFGGFDKNTCTLKCKQIHGEPKVVPLFPDKQLDLKSPFKLPCPVKGEATISDCLLCIFFKGVKTSGKVMCTHSKAPKHEFFSYGFTKPKTKPRQKTLQTPSLSWVFGEQKPKMQRLKISVVCTQTQIRVNCQSFETSLEVCEKCTAYDGLDKDNFHINCKTEARPILFVACPQQVNEGSVLLSNCQKCLKFQKVENGMVVCSHLKRNFKLRINKPPITKRRSVKISRLTGKQKEYIDVPD